MPSITAEPGIAEPGSAEPGATFSAPLILIRRPWLGVTIDGVEQTAVRSAACHFGFDQRYATAEIVLRTVTGGVDVTYWLPVEISMGASALTAVPRFYGYILPTDNTSWVPGGVLHCRGPLGIAGALGNYDETEGVQDSLFGTDLSGLADEVMVAQILAYYGLTGRYTYTGTPSTDTITGTGKLLGINNLLPEFEPTWWKKGQAGLDFIDALDPPCAAQDALGNWGIYRTYEVVGGLAVPTIYRRLITANPQGDPSDADFTLSEGVDLLRDLQVTHDPTQNVNRVRVRGADPDGIGAVEFMAQAASFYLPPFMPNDPSTGWPVVAREFSFPLIERENESDPGDGLSAENKATQLHAELNTEVVTVRGSTYREDLFNLGQTHYIYAPNRIGVFQNMWCNRIDITMSDKRVFRQQFEHIVKN